MTQWQKFIQEIPPDEKYDLDERCAIHEFDGGLNRIEAEIRTMADYRRDRWNRLRKQAGLE